MKKLFFLIILYLIFLIPNSASAALIIQAPKYIGLNSGLVGFWSFDGKDTAGDGSVITFYDRSGQGNNGTTSQTTGVTRVIGKIGQGIMSLNSTNSHVDVADSASLDITAELTISAWVKEPANKATDRLKIAAKSASSYEFDISNFPTAPVLRINKDGSAVLQSMNYPTDKQWHHVVGIYNDAADSTTLCIDGSCVVEGGETNILTNNGIDLVIGRESISDSVNLFHDGFIDDVRVYNRALSADEIKRLYKIGSTLKVATTISNDSLKKGLVGHWTFDGPDTNIKANVTADKSGNGNHGTLTNGPTVVPGKLGQALNFDGVNDYVDAGDAASLQITGSMTISAWVWANAFSADDDAIASKAGSTGVDNGYQLVDSIDTGPRTIQFKVANSASVEVLRYGETTLQTNKWYHIVGIYDAPGNTLNVYLNSVFDNGTLTGTIPSSQRNSTQNVNIGQKPTGSNRFNGQIDDVRIYNRALTGDEIKRLYNIGR